ncbi:bifunctional diaminohydroxyphosphoribosylaminopyrimidine deaminase/5-amino-6-(5-phosphoribosylamino)uracil reductase RibD [Marivirga sp.]|uniref:bifunctional diaminohydroxyphosphoribosylaminopyrimidine deaminase/5-amino-6-(5-phosphoribosylamino)uracil reductase RibD n=1 Tax=Marivirga sp. TaxID=2018662 RepID=UPI002D810A78|nr:bifunctional diaminohydroxyphosphoribosylaminopyrimidine deaminase/5-amino-6-(5-phosphoribosylamino)uracil reductase RibD [Marivirga sp.]HET8860353.1 bifunctional diaminohydroxyphosphoribosylaminopyrimidine deaminase/5-amino-6-(5-phosphoribosylamino)uracil reductase RibD [Marivirga sp.]
MIFYLVLSVMRKVDQLFMQRALQLAGYGKPSVTPNPMVGCVIVHEGKIIGEGWHQKAGEPHAEVLAIRSVKNQGLLKSSIAYVTLEPCAHYGKTPPCAELLVQKEIKKVVIGAVDSNPLVAGKGIEILKNAGIKVESGVLEQECLAQNKPFFTFMQKNRPYIILKWAQTADGFIARDNFNSKWISNTLSRQLVHKWRTEIDAILIGKNTAKYDNPTLTARDWPGKNPIRFVIDHQLALDKDLNVFDGQQKTIVFHSKAEQIKRQGLEMIELEEEDFLTDMIKYLHQKKIQSVLVEGGAQTIQSFINAGLWDEARIFTAPIIFEKGIKVAELKNHQLVSQENIQDKNQTDVLSIYYNSSNNIKS